MKFLKIHAFGNDFVVFGNPSSFTQPTKNLISALCDRHYGVGADCAIFVGKSKNCDYSMHVYNPDGFEAEMCGNALRCAAKYVHLKGFFKKKSFICETLSGVRSVKIEDDTITTEIGKPEILNIGSLEINDMCLPYTFISLGNPHCVVFTASLNDEEFEYLGPAIENHILFPEGTNVEFAAITDNNRIAMRVWERGIGETLSCVTGSCACVAAAHNRLKMSSSVNVFQKGGIVTVDVTETGDMFVTGKCTAVFEGEFYKTDE